jgi:hypothetical protein
MLAPGRSRSQGRKPLTAGNGTMGAHGRDRSHLSDLCREGSSATAGPVNDSIRQAPARATSLANGQTRKQPDEFSVSESRQSMS